MNKLILLVLAGVMVGCGVKAELIDVNGNVLDCKTANNNTCYQKIDCPQMVPFDGVEYALRHQDELRDGNTPITDGSMVFCRNMGRMDVFTQRIIKPVNTQTTETVCGTDKLYYMSGCYTKDAYCEKKHDSTYKWDTKIDDCAQSKTVVTSTSEQQRITALKAMIESLKNQINILLARLAQIKK